MKRLTTYSIMDIDEVKEEIHHKEVEKIFSKIYSLPNGDCRYEIKYIDKYHSKKIKPRYEYDELYNFMEVLEAMDLKNGVDIFLEDDNNIVFKVYGQGYEYKGEYGLIMAQIRVSYVGRLSKEVDFRVLC
ncbi:hypothetical protein [Streptococcus equi]|uniref:Phage protein n=1 Tax=Streptococcus equi subsp. zooepidemicus Sz4is TaxID=1381082 RepID=A0AAW3GKQ8_STRSZ|nr:hypothetical protein AT55_02030 [Streptococcus equi subsp. zooepidemicus Sz4is]